MTITFAKGPLGCAILRDDVVVGTIKDRRPWGCILKIDGMRFAARDGSVAQYIGLETVEGLVLKDMAAAQAKARELLS